MFFKDALDFLWRRVDGVAPRWLLKGHAEHVVASFGDDFVIVVFNLFFPLRRHIFLHSGEHKVGCALEYGHLCSGFCDLGQHLYGGGASTNDSDAFARHFESFWPSGRVKNGPLKSLLSRVIGEHGLRNHAHGADKILGAMGFPTLSADIPQPRFIVELSTLNFCAQLEHGPQCKFVHDKFQVVLCLLPARVALAPGPLLQHLF